MYLKYVQIVNFKNLKTARFEFAKGANTIIGENDSGKSNALTAIRILLDDNYYYNTKRLKETDFSYALGDWRGHWIIISAFFDEISSEDKSNEFCAELTPEQENIDFLKSYIRCADKEFGTVSLFIRPCRAKRAELAEAAQNGTFEAVRSQIKLSDYEFYYTSRSQADFTDENVYKSIVGDICAGQYVNPEDDDQSVLGSKIDIMNVWQHISTVFIDALRDVESELRKPKNPIRQIIDTIEGNIEETDIDDIKRKISELNQKISHIPQVSDIGSQVNQKLLEMIGAIYSPEIKLESRLKEDFATLARYLTISPSNQKDIDLLGLGHLNILYIAMKLVEFEVNRNRELLNIMIIEEPEAHIHTHIQKTLFNNLQVTHTYTQVVMSTHSTHLSEVSDIEKVNVMKKVDEQTSLVMKPTNGLDQFGADVLEYKGIPFSKILSRYLDAKRSVLLFSKGVILVEGDGEEILIPALVKKVLGVSLDEMGIGLINIGSVGFENVACVFDESRLQRKCSIVTDLDVVVDGAKKSSQVAMDRGASRRKKLSQLFDANPYVSAFYAPHTLEVDFASEDNNKRFVCAIIKRAYKDAATKAIYGSLGGVAKTKQELETLYETDFDSMSLRGCYRSTQRLVDLYSRFEVSRTEAHSVAKHKDELGEIHFFDSVYYTDLASEIAALIKEELENGTKAEEICVIAPQWGMLFDLSRKLRIILPDIPFDAPDISPIKYDPMNPLFLIAKLLFLPSGKNVTLRKRIATEFISIVRDDFRIMVPDNIQNYDVLSAVNCCRGTDADGITCLGSAIERVFAILHVRISKEAALSALTNSFFDEIRPRVDRYALSTDFNSISKYFGEKNGVVISTLHGVKGEEYTSVIATGLLNGYLPHWDYIRDPIKKLCRKNETYKLLYVLCSRAKKNLYLFSESGRTTRNGFQYTSTDELSLIADML